MTKTLNVFLFSKIQCLTVDPNFHVWKSWLSCKVNACSWCIFGVFLYILKMLLFCQKNSSHFWTKNDLAAVIMWFLLELKITFCTFFLKKLQLKKQFHSMFSFPATQKVIKVLPNNNKKKITNLVQTLLDHNIMFYYRDY